MKPNKPGIIRLNFQENYLETYSIVREAFSSVPDNISTYTYLATRRVQHQKMLKNTQVFGINDSNGKLVGFTQYVIDSDDTAKLEWLGISPKEQKSPHRYGTALLNGSIDILSKETGIKLIKAVSTATAKDFYIKNGFQQLQHTKFENQDYCFLSRTL